MMMSPIVFRYKSLCFGWYSNEAGEPVHVHVFKGMDRTASAKFWIKKESIEMTYNRAGLSQKELKMAARYIAVNRSDFIARWYDFFDAE